MDNITTTHVNNTVVHFSQCATTIKARNTTPGGNVSKHPKHSRYFGFGCYLGRWLNFFHGYQHSMFYTKRHVHMHAYHTRCTVI